MKYAKDNLAVRTVSTGLVILKRGDVFPDDHPAVLERPDLFADGDPRAASVATEFE